MAAYRPHSVWYIASTRVSKAQLRAIIDSTCGKCFPNLSYSGTLKCDRRLGH